MKKAYLFIILSILIFGNFVFAIDRPLVWTTVSENWGRIIFNRSTDFWINKAAFVDDSFKFGGNFRSENVWWCTFDLWTLQWTLGAKLVENGTKYNMEWYAWCENAWWIDFNPRGVIDVTTHMNSDVFFDPDSGEFFGYGRNFGFWYIDMADILLDINPPTITNNVFTTNHEKTLSEIIDDKHLVSIEVEKWNNNFGVTLYNSGSDTHDFRLSKIYTITATDIWGNTVNGTLQVVASEPSEAINNSFRISPTATASQFISSLSESKIADNKDNHSIELHLKDQYGNPIIDEYIGGTQIKDVSTNISFDNTLDKNQLEIEDDLWDAINFSWTNWPILMWWIWSTSSDGTSPNGEYITEITSYAPSVAGYQYVTGSNDISLTNLEYKIIWMNWYNDSQVWWKIDNITNKIWTNPFKFTPAIEVISIATPLWEKMDVWYTYDFDVDIDKNSTENFSNVLISNQLSINDNQSISFQTPIFSSGGDDVCNWYNKTISNLNANYESTDSQCNLEGYLENPATSNYLVNISSNIDTTLKFSWIPAIIQISPSQAISKYNSEVKYKIDWYNISYPSYQDTSSTINHAVKVVGLTSGNSYIVWTLEGQNLQKATTLSKSEFRAEIKKNVSQIIWFAEEDTELSNVRYIYDRNPTISEIYYGSLDKKQTLIVKWWDIIIDVNLTKFNNNPIWLIALEDENGNGGNIIINKNVWNIEAIMFAEKSVISWEKNWADIIFYSDDRSAKDQLYILWSVYSSNTIWWSALWSLICPYYIVCTDAKEARRYDFNYFRFYDPDTITWSPSDPIPSEWEEYPFVVIFDSILQTSPPPWF